MHVCPSEDFMRAWEQIPKTLMMKSEVEDKPSCPLCLLAVGQLYNVIKNDKTEVMRFLSMTIDRDVKIV